MEKTYKQSGKYLGVMLACDGILMFIFIGFIGAAYHLLEYFGSSLKITKNGVVLKRGILSFSSVDIPYNKINSITIKKGPLGNMLGYGDILLMTGNDVAGIPFKGISDPDAIREEIQSHTT